MKDLLLHEGPKEDFHIRNILREAHFTYEYKKISELMLEMKDYSVNFTIVLDEYGSTAGLITFEDLLEEIVARSGTNTTVPRKSSSSRLAPMSTSLKVP